MRILGRYFIAPILIHKTDTTWFNDVPDLSMRLRQHKMGGTYKTTSWTLQIKTPKREFQWTFCWRGDVTVKHWQQSKVKP